MQSGRWCILIAQVVVLDCGGGVTAIPDEAMGSNIRVIQGLLVHHKRLSLPHLCIAPRVWQSELVRICRNVEIISCTSDNILLQLLHGAVARALFAITLENQCLLLALLLWTTIIFEVATGQNVVRRDCLLVI